MNSLLRRVSDRFSSEVSAWLGVRESLDLQVLSYLIPETLVLHMKANVDVERILPDGISAKLIAALEQDRSLLTIFVRDTQLPEGDVYVLTIDRARDRVDRELTSWQLLADPWDGRWTLPLSADVPDASDDYRVSLLDFTHAFALIAMYPIQSRYRRAFLRRQESIAKMLGHSQRFESLIDCLGKQMDSQTRISFTHAMRNLWKHEQWLERKVDFGEAKRVLSVVPMKIQTYDHNAQYWEMHDPGPHIAMHSWFDEEGNRIAFAEVFGDGVNPSSSKTSAKVYVFGSLFYDEEADCLLGCFLKKS